MTQDPRTYVPARERSSFGQFELHRTHLTTRIPGEQFRGEYLSTNPVVAPDVARSAALTVAGHARDAEDARDLLAVLGLIAAPIGSDEPLPCGHSRSSLRRRKNGLRGVECTKCNAAAERVRYARKRKARVTAS